MNRVLYSPEQVAKQLGVHRQLVGRWIRQGLLEALTLPSAGRGARRHFRVTEQSLDQFLERCGEKKNATGLRPVAQSRR